MISSPQIDKHLRKYLSPILRESGFGKVSKHTKRGVSCLPSMGVHFSRTQWFAFAGVALASIGLGFAGAKILANETIGYVAGYTWFGLMLIGVPLVLSLLLIGAALSFRVKTRWFGGLAIMAAVLIVGSSIASFKILDALGHVLYKHEQMVPFGPDVKASFVIYFKSGATSEQINDFSTKVLSRPEPDGRGHDLPEGVSTFLRVPPVQGHDAIAITFSPTATPEECKRLVSDVKVSPLVYKVLEDVVPADVKKLD